MQRTLAPEAPPGAPHVERMISASVMGSAVAPYAEMERIRHAALPRNERDGIHAALLCQSGWYVHWIEGPGSAVRGLMSRVRADPRHHSVRLLHHSLGQRYLQTPWSMMLAPGGEPHEVFGARVEELHRARQGGVQFPPTSVVRRLSAPLRVRPAGSAADADTFHRVGVCSADDGRSFDFVRWLADRYRRPLESRRFAGAQDLDSGSDYVEFLLGGEPCRVISVSRAGLQHGLRRTFLPDWPHLLLLFGMDERRNIVLMERVVEACAGLPQVPRLLGAAPELHVHTRMMVAARVAGLGYVQLCDAQPEAHEAVWDAVTGQLRRAGPPPSSQWDLTHPGWVP